MKKAAEPSPAGMWKLITKTEQKIESTMTEEAAPGYIENMYGSFDREDLTSELLKLYEQLQKQVPADSDVKYRHAGALMRASRFDEARNLYFELLESHTSAHLMLAMIELKCGDRVAAVARLNAYNKRCTSEGMPFMQSTLEKIALPPANT